MPPVENPLPEGTDTIIEGAGIEGAGTAGSTDDAAASRPKPGGTTASADLRGLFFERIETLKGEAGDRARDYAQTGKDRITGALDDLVRLVEDTAGEIDTRVGSQYGDYARRAAEGIGGFADAVKAKDVDDLFDDARTFIARSPGVAIGVAAALGFVVARLARAGVAEATASRDDAPAA